MERIRQSSSVLDGEKIDIEFKIFATGIEYRVSDRWCTITDGRIAKGLSFSKR